MLQWLNKNINLRRLQEEGIIMQRKTSLIRKALTVLLLVGCLVMCVIYAGAEGLNGKCGDNAVWSIDSDTKTLIISGTGGIQDYTEGTAPWLTFRSKFNKVEIREGITRIGNYSFYACSGVEQVHFPASLKEIGGSAFTDCTSIKGVYITDMKAWCHLEYIGTGDNSIGWSDDFRANPLYVSNGAKLYLNGELVKDLVIPEGTTRIAHVAFYGCDSITSVKLPATLTQTGWYSFTGCKIDSVYVPSVESWCNITFGPFTFHAEDSALNPKNLYVAGKQVKDVVIPGTVTTIKAGAFMGFEGVSSITVPASVTKIEERAFYNCKAGKVVISEGLQTIGEQAFSGYTGAPLVIPATVYKVEDYALPKTVAFRGNKPVLGKLDEASFYLYPKGDSSWGNVQVNKIAWHPDKGDSLDYIEVTADIELTGTSATEYRCDQIKVECKQCGDKVVFDKNCKVTVEDVVEATCTTDGYRKFISSTELKNDFLRVEKSEKVAALGHQIIMLAGKEPNCTQEGYTEGKKCNRCDLVMEEQQVIPANGHKEVAVSGKAPTCTAGGWTEGTKCSVCNVELQKQQVLSPKGHVEKVLPAKAATCTEKGLTEGKMCTECGKEFAKQREIPALGHNYSDWSENKSTGEKTRVCGTCGHIDRKSADAQAGGGAAVWIIVGVAVVLLGGAGVFCYFKWDLVSSWLRKIGMYFKAKTK